MKRTGIGTIALFGVIGIGVGACDGRGEDRPMGEMPGETPMSEPMQGMPGMEGMMQRHAQEAEAMTSSMRQHIGQMRQLTPEQWHERMGEHVGQVSQMLGLMNRQMREMDMGMGMSDEEMGRMMGMSGEEHRRMTEDMESLRADVEQLQTAPRDEVRQRIPAHLDRLERMVEMMETSVEGMRDA